MSSGSALYFAILAMAAVIAVAAADPAIAGFGTQVQDPPPRPGQQGVPGGQCPTFVVFTAPDGCSTCACSVDARMTDCSRSACSEPGNYTINECVENALYVGSDGCNSCQCNAWRSFSWCTREICLLSDASPPLAAARPSPRPPLGRSSPLRPSRPPTRRTASPATTPASFPASSAPSGTPPPTTTRGSARRRRPSSSRRPPGFGTTQGGQS